MATDASDSTLAAYADAQARFEAAGGYRWRDEARETVRGLGFEMDELDRDLSTFSGGELTRASLARALAANRTCCCWTSRPTTWTSRRSSGSSGRSARWTQRSSWSPTTAGSWSPSATRFSSWGRGAPSSSPARGMSGVSRRRAASSSSIVMPSAARPTSPGSSASSSGSGPRTPSRPGRSRSRSRSTASSATHLARSRRRPSRLRSPSVDAAVRQGRAGHGGRDDRCGVEAAIRRCRALGRGGRARLPDRAQRLGQVHADLHARRRAQAVKGRSRSATTSSSDTCDSTRRCRPSRG